MKKIKSFLCSLCGSHDKKTHRKPSTRLNIRNWYNLKIDQRQILSEVLIKANSCFGGCQWWWRWQQWWLWWWWWCHYFNSLHCVVLAILLPQLLSLLCNEFWHLKDSLKNLNWLRAIWCCQKSSYTPSHTHSHTHTHKSCLKMPNKTRNPFLFR